MNERKNPITSVFNLIKKIGKKSDPEQSDEARSAKPKTEVEIKMEKYLGYVSRLEYFFVFLNRFPNKILDDQLENLGGIVKKIGNLSAKFEKETIRPESPETNLNRQDLLDEFKNRLEVVKKGLIAITTSDSLDNKEGLLNSCEETLKELRIGMKEIVETILKKMSSPNDDPTELMNTAIERHTSTTN